MSYNWLSKYTPLMYMIKDVFDDSFYLTMIEMKYDFIILYLIFTYISQTMVMHVFEMKKYDLFYLIRALSKSLFFAFLNNPLWIQYYFFANIEPFLCDCKITLCYTRIAVMYSQTWFLQYLSLIIIIIKPSTFYNIFYKLCFINILVTSKTELIFIFQNNIYFKNKILFKDLCILILLYIVANIIIGPGIELSISWF